MIGYLGQCSLVSEDYVVLQESKAEISQNYKIVLMMRSKLVSEHSARSFFDTNFHEKVFRVSNDPHQELTQHSTHFQDYSALFLCIFERGKGTFIKLNESVFEERPLYPCARGTKVTLTLFHKIDQTAANTTKSS